MPREKQIAIKPEEVIEFLQRLKKHAPKMLQGLINLMIFFEVYFAETHKDVVDERARAREKKAEFGQLLRKYLIPQNNQEIIRECEQLQWQEPEASFSKSKTFFENMLYLRLVEFMMLFGNDQPMLGVLFLESARIQGLSSLSLLLQNLAPSETREALMTG